MQWLRHDAARRMHPKFRRAGFWGAVAVDAAWEFACMFGRADGDVSDFWTTDSVAGWLQLEDERLADLAAGMARAERAGLIDRDGNAVAIHAWAEAQPEPSRVRVQRHRTRHQNDSNVTNVTNVTLHETPVTDVTPTDGRTDVTDIQTDGEERAANAPRKRAAAPLPSEHWAWGCVDSYHAARLSEPVNRGAEAETLAALERLDGHPAALVAEVLAWVAADVVDPPRGTWAGWAGVVRSLVSLRQRKTKGDASKFEKALAQYRDAVKPRAEQRTRYPSAPATDSAEHCACGHMRLYPWEPCGHCGAEPTRSL